MTDKRSTDLEAAARRKLLVRFTRPFERGSVHGYVLAVSSRWLLLTLVGDGIRFNGFPCFRLRDVRRLQIPHPHAGFVEAALKKRGERLPRRPRVSVASTEALLRSANRSFPLVTIHREEVDPDVCWIGRVLDMDKRRVTLLEIDPVGEALEQYVGSFKCVVQAGEASNLYTALAALPKPFADVEKAIENDKKNIPSEPLAGMTREKFENDLGRLPKQYDRVRILAKRLEANLAALQCVEAIRSYAASHSGQLPQTLAEITEVSMPNDPMSGAASRYTRTGAMAVLESATPPGGDAKDITRYEIAVKN